MVGRIQELRDRLPGIAAEEKRLRSERTSVCFPEKDDNGEVTLKIDNEPLYIELTERMNEKIAEKNKILDKVSRLEQILGEGALSVPTGYDELDLVGRRKMELCQYFINKIMKPGNGDRYYTLPEQAIQDERYLTEKAKIMPLIEAAEARMAKERERAALANEILAES